MGGQALRYTCTEDFKLSGPAFGSNLMQKLKEYSVFLGVIAFTIIALVIGILLPTASAPPSSELPWQIQQSPQGMRVFGLTLKHSTLKEAQDKFQEQAEISLFLSEAKQLAVEAYFDQINLGGLRAKVVLSTVLSQAELQGMYDRGIRISGMSSGHKIELHPDDKARVANAAIASINYLPSAALEETLIVQRFGNPASRIREEKNDILHLLYPQHGLDIALNAKNKAVFQYVPPADFNAVLAPLLKQQLSK